MLLHTSIILNIIWKIISRNLFAFSILTILKLFSYDNYKLCFTILYLYFHVIILFNFIFLFFYVYFHIFQGGYFSGFWDWHFLWDLICILGSCFFYLFMLFQIMIKNYFLITKQKHKEKKERKK